MYFGLVQVLSLGVCLERHSTHLQLFFVGDFIGLETPSSPTLA